MLGGGKGGPNDYSIRVDCPGSDAAEFAIAIVRHKTERGVAQANAHLIAAAPELLEALKLVVSTMGQTHDFVMLEAMVKLAAEAIAKAEGK